METLKINDIRDSIMKFIHSLNTQDKAEIVLEFLQVEAKKKKDEDALNAMMIADIKNNKIKIYPEIVQLSYEKGNYRNNFKISLLEFFNLVICHEFGHFDDNFDVEKEKNELHSLFEKSYKEGQVRGINSSIIPEINAWNYGEKYVSTYLLEAYKTFNVSNLLTYTKRYRKLLGENLEVFIEHTDERVKNIFNYEELFN
ncbi:hypothetical protein MHH81_20845 [Psychrobacillus sp. FSL H8-0484]|uniref:hypothetical protein n=1 Tax=Psychrobacillus sp. FSL H8-0484 TaxID=2921390 RepID=UPI0030F850EF